MGRVYMGGNKRLCNMVGKTLETTLFTWCCFPCVHFCELYLSCVYCCILCVFVVSYVYSLYLTVFVVLCVYCCSYFRRRTAGKKSVSVRSCDRAPRQRFFLVSLRLHANAEMLPKFPSRYYMPLM
jgi:hypothetical protein